jgi:uncharacterized repeat protein (TIGR03837 family)
MLNEIGLADVLVEAFACRMPQIVMNSVSSKKRIIINLEHLSAEEWVSGYHKKESLLGIENVTKYFFMPGFTNDTGGILIDSNVEARKPWLRENQKAFIKDLVRVNEWKSIIDEADFIGSVFTYNRPFDSLVRDVGILGKKTFLLVFGEKSHAGMVATLDRFCAQQIDSNRYILGSTDIIFMPFVQQEDYDALLCCTDFNLVRGEDSLVRALLAEKPFVWNAYLQQDKYQQVKVSALLDFFKPWFKNFDRIMSDYQELMLQFNDRETENGNHATGECFLPFFENLPIFEAKMQMISYFMRKEGNLIRKFNEFLSGL